MHGPTAACRRLRYRKIFFVRCGRFCFSIPKAWHYVRMTKCFCSCMNGRRRCLWYWRDSTRRDRDGLRLVRSRLKMWARFWKNDTAELLLMDSSTQHSNLLGFWDKTSCLTDRIFVCATAMLSNCGHRAVEKGIFGAAPNQSRWCKTKGPFAYAKNEDKPCVAQKYSRKTMKERDVRC